MQSRAVFQAPSIVGFGVADAEDRHSAAEEVAVRGVLEC